MKKNYQTPKINTLILNTAEDILATSGSVTLGEGDYDGANASFDDFKIVVK